MRAAAAALLFLWRVSGRETLPTTPSSGELAWRRGFLRHAAGEKSLASGEDGVLHGLRP
jgi:hypothetical protein